MKEIHMYLLIGLFFTAGLFFCGCSNPDDSSGTGTVTPAAPVDGSGDKEDAMDEDKLENASNTATGGFQRVSLNVPNMTCSGCAGSVRSALANIEGVDEDSIETDISQHLVSFQVRSGVDLDAKLAEFSDNQHLKGWTRSEN